MSLLDTFQLQLYYNAIVVFLNPVRSSKQMDGTIVSQFAENFALFRSREGLLTVWRGRKGSFAQTLDLDKAAKYICV